MSIYGPQLRLTQSGEHTYWLQTSKAISHFHAKLNSANEPNMPEPISTKPHIKYDGDSARLVFIDHTAPKGEFKNRVGDF